MTSRDDVVQAAAEVYGDGPWVSAALQRNRPYICPFELLIDRVPPGSRVLDVGCGSGLFLSLLAKRGCIVEGVGFDVQHAAIERANVARRHLPEPDVLRFVHADAAFAWPVGRFDLVSMVDVMHHVAPSEQRGVIAKIAAALRPGGLLLYNDMVQRPRWRSAANRLHDLVLARQWIHYMPIGQVVHTAAECGLELTEQLTVNRFWYGHELALFRLRAGR